ncbi:Lsr2 family protein [Microbacterium sp. MYb62]|uniref:histone-like nucleoid-structuring protein Lsr2 n=1 Tax=Microbacterium sp. MYb62 TaxID=1848690 RepID=UPI000CFCEC29|nr:Lsr2 family protein [Microbacterium sp. MYb62]PRB17258.1 hypothetical protein CQ042_05510 [Microbacterium sp. MYb62]
MAQRHIVELIDDLDQTPIDGAGGSHTFALDGREYEIDLSEANADRLRGALAPFIGAGRRVGSSKIASASAPTRGRARSRNETDAIRVWARRNGYEVSDRGRIAESVLNAYRSQAT